MEIKNRVNIGVEAAEAIGIAINSLAIDELRE